MDIEIVSNGTSIGTHVKDKVTGEAINHVVAIKWEIELDGLATVDLKIVGVPVRITGKLNPVKKKKK